MLDNAQAERGRSLWARLLAGFPAGETSTLGGDVDIFIRGAYIDAALREVERAQSEAAKAILRARLPTPAAIRLSSLRVAAAMDAEALARRSSPPSEVTAEVYEGSGLAKLDSSLRTPSSSLERPAQQPYGVSPRGAEQLVSEWLRYLGEGDAEVTRYSRDGGVDVEGHSFVAQVKHQKGSVSVKDVRELAGVASERKRNALFFTSSRYTPEAIAFADRATVAFFLFNAEDATLRYANEGGRAYLDKRPRP